jgi:hypothetical protein
MPARDVATASGYSPTSGTTQASIGNRSLVEDYLPRIERITRMKSQTINYFNFFIRVISMIRGSLRFCAITPH